ncbi:hypothetical protein TNCV_1635471 [Trichonephila clavipes]|nr:hypothetical protein TNCV_1635471 [Trichonephila clavipes]
MKGSKMRRKLGADARILNGTGEVVLEVMTPAEDEDISSYQQRNGRTTAQQVANQFLAASGKQISRKTCQTVWGGELCTRRPVAW